MRTKFQLAIQEIKSNNMMLPTCIVSGYTTTDNGNKYNNNNKKKKKNKNKNKNSFTLYSPKYFIHD